MLTLECLKERFTVCKLPDLSGADLNREFTFLGRTDGELSLVCPENTVPENAAVREDGWRGFRVRGSLDFSLVGILARISAVLAQAGVSIFALSTFDTDYVLVKEESFQKALAALAAEGYEILK